MGGAAMWAQRAAAYSGKLVLAAVYDHTKPEGVAVRLQPAPSAGSSTTVLVMVHAAGVNPVDAKFQVGDKLPKFMEPVVRWLMTSNTVGFDLAGVVVDAPPRSGFKEGDRVFGTMPPLTGSVAELVAVPLHQLALTPPGLSMLEAAALPLSGLTAVQSVLTSSYHSTG